MTQLLPLERFALLALVAVAFSLPASAQCWDQHFAVGTTDPRLPNDVALGPGVAVFGQPRFDPTLSPIVEDVVRVFEGPPGAMTLAAELRSSLPAQPAASFGVALDLDGDWLVVGDPRSTVPGRTFGGAVHVYRRGASGWSLTEVIAHPGRHATFGGSFGEALDLEGDRLVVGAPFTTTPNTVGAFENGIAYVYERVGAQWQLVQSVRPSTTSPFAGFARSVALDGDELAVGGTEDPASAPIPPNATGAGAVFLFTRGANGVFASSGIARASNPLQNAGLGFSVDLEGDLLVAGAPGVEDPATGAFAAGQVHVFERTGGAWNEVDVLSLETTRPYQRLGTDVAIEGRDVVVSGESFGGARRFADAGGSWLETRRYVTVGGAAWPNKMRVRLALDQGRLLLSDPAGATLFPVQPMGDVQIGCEGVPFPSGVLGVPDFPVILDVRSELRLSAGSFDLQLSTFAGFGAGITFFGPGPANVSLGSGTLCVGGTLTRVAIVGPVPGLSNHRYSVDLTSQGGAAITAGMPLHFQHWFRVPGGTHLSSSMVLTFCP